MYKENFVGQTFGTRLIIKNFCDEEDWIKIGKKPPKEPKKYR